MRSRFAKSPDGMRANNSAAERAQDFNFPAQPTTDALLEFSKQTRIEVLFSFNALRHARTDRLAIRLAGGGGEIVLEVRDFGSGFDPVLLASDERVGLELMRRRAESVGGALTVYTAPGAGTTVRAVVPVAR